MEIFLALLSGCTARTWFIMGVGEGVKNTHTHNSSALADGVLAAPPDVHVLTAGRQDGNSVILETGRPGFESRLVLKSLPSSLAPEPD